ncbi:MAG: cytochrome d ubiquinol oxidase subunit II [Chloroflexota bacterium]
MDLNILWFVLVAVLYTGFFVLEGFDFGVGMLMPFLSKDDTERRAVINTIGPHWDANEVWLMTAGGATFAAFPHWYATLFSGFYVALFLLVIALIFRGVAFEFRSKDDNPTWRKFWDWTISISSFLAALLFGVAFANLTRGLPIDASMAYTGGFWYLLNPFGLMGGLFAVVVSLLHGSIFLSLKTTEGLLDRVTAVTKKLWIAAAVVFVGSLVVSFFALDFSAELGILTIVPFLALAAILLAGYFIGKKQFGWAFGMTASTILFSVVTHFLYLYPNVMFSTTNPDWSLTIYNASSSDYTLTVMSWVALIFVPVVLAYQAWTYYTFRKRISADPQELEY